MQNSAIIIFWLGSLAILLSSCCKCRGDEPHFTNEELLELPSLNYDSLRFVSNNSDTVFNKTQKHIFTIKPKCSFGPCCICPEDYTAYGSFEQSVEGNYCHSFQIEITKDEKGFTKTYFIRDYFFTQFDSIIQNYNVGGVDYPLVYYKKNDNGQFLYCDKSLNKIFFDANMGIVKYEYVNGEVWEMK